MKLKHLLIALCGVFMIGLSSCNANETTIKYAQLPATVKQFCGKHFAGAKVKTVKADTDDAITEYDVYFIDGTKVEIDATGNWKEVSNRTAAVPVSMLPVETQNYLSTNYPTQTVVKVEKDTKGYEVTFSNGTELDFNTAGAFVKVDK